MPENILVVEYEPRYTDRVKQALAGQPFEAWFAKDGEEALRVIDSKHPRLIVLSSVVPKVSTSDLIRNIRGRDSLKATPILLTVSGYRGDSPRSDAVRLGASDILPKPYSEVEFLGKVQQMLGVAPVAWSPVLDGDFTVRMASVPPPGNGQLTSNEIFGELLDDDRSPSNAARKPMSQKDDVDKMLADTLAGMMPQPKRRDTTPIAAPAPAPPPAAAAPPPPAPAAPPKARPSSPALDKRFQDTLSGLEKNARRVTSPGTVATPTVVTPIPTPPPAAPRPTPPPAAVAANETVRVAIPKAERMPISQPVFPAAVPVPPLEDEEPADGIKFGQYVLLEKIATGGMAEVWKARMRGVEGFQKIVAIKKILPHLSDNQDFIEMFVDEAKLAAQLNHNNIIHIYDLGKIQSSYYIAMEYIDGYDLKNILKKAQERDQPLSVEIALFIASKIAAALDYAHRKRDFEDKEMGLVHRDVSPQNVLISEEGDIKLCDFGIAKAASKASHTQAGALKGKLQYMSPEQAWGRNIDKRSDIFALATVLFEMLTARKLFSGDNELSILEQVREARVTTPSQYNDEVTPQIDAIVLKALQKDPANRYQTAGEMQRDLDAVLYSFKPTPTSADLAIYMHRLATSVATPAHTMEMHAPEPPQAANELKPLKPAPVVATPTSIPTSIPAAMAAAGRGAAHVYSDVNSRRDAGRRRGDAREETAGRSDRDRRHPRYRRRHRLFRDAETEGRTRSHEAGRRADADHRHFHRRHVHRSRPRYDRDDVDRTGDRSNEGQRGSRQTCRRREGAPRTGVPHAEPAGDQHDASASGRRAAAAAGSHANRCSAAGCRKPSGARSAAARSDAATGRRNASRATAGSAAHAGRRARSGRHSRTYPGAHHAPGRGNLSAHRARAARAGQRHRQRARFGDRSDSGDESGERSAGRAQ